MRRLVPEIICRNYVEKKFEGEFESFVLTCDISGFTSITESLSEKSFEGSEIITDTINRIYKPVIDFIKASGGFISSFAGDSFASLFPVSNIGSNKSITEVSENISRLLFKMEEVKTKFGDFKFKVKIGLSKGIVSWRIVESDFGTAFYFYSQAFKKSYDMLKYSSRGSVAIDDSVYTETNFDKDLTDSGFMTLNPENKKADLKEVESLFFDEETLTKKFFPESVLKMSVSGEFRGIIASFVFLDEKSVVDRNIIKAMEITSKYSGYFNKIDFGDKGWVILVVFGAPYGVENIYKKACNFAFETVLSLRGNVKIGMTSGTAYAGFLGSEKRAEYTVLGTTVNLASRIAQNSEWGEVTIDKSMLKDMSRYCSVKKEKKQTFRGFEKNEIIVCSITQGDLSQQAEVFEGPFIAREEE
ncbi:hypothetical protein JXA84_09245, partial [candidate division WOR-3 bacterium]|nr:hypothetical protein [candidate division WOR-3 bacterium]